MVDDTDIVLELLDATQRMYRKATGRSAISYVEAAPWTGPRGSYVAMVGSFAVYSPSMLEAVCALLDAVGARHGYEHALPESQP